MQNDLFEGGEDALTARLAKLATSIRLPRGTVGIGDDAAVLPGEPVRVVSVDLLVQGQHFRDDLMSPEDLAHRALEANLSDIAAMGARPTGVFLGLAWPDDRPARRRGSRLLTEFIRAAGERGVPVLGGDTVWSCHAMISVTVIGIPHAGGPVLRSGGRPGDVLVVTGPLGASGTGLRVLTRALPSRARDRAALAAAGEAIDAFRRPRARLDLAPAMARHASALMDLSDGLGLDLPRLAAASGCGFVVEADAVPIHPATLRLEGDAALERALGGGEDFELLAAIRPQAVPAARRAVARAGGVLHVVGRLVSRRSGSRLRTKEKLVEWPRTGWDPFGPDTTFSSRSSGPIRSRTKVPGR